MTWDPWPCCGKPAEKEGWRGGRPKNTICRECTHLIQVGRDALETARASGRRPYLWTWVRHGWAEYYGAYDFSGDRSFLAHAMFHLVEALWATREKRPHGFIPAGSVDGPVLDCDEQHRNPILQGQVTVHIDRNIRDRVNELDAAIRKALASVYAQGVARGRSTLLGLADGDLSLSDFEKKIR